MLDLVGNPKDKFSQGAVHTSHVDIRCIFETALCDLLVELWSGVLEWNHGVAYWSEVLEWSGMNSDFESFLHNICSIHRQYTMG